MISPRPSLAVLLCSEEFRETWCCLASSLDVEPAVARSVDELPDLSLACGVLIAATGVEHDAPRAILALRGLCASEILVVGLATDYRSAAAALRAGADNYLVLPDDLGAIRSWVAGCVERVRPAGGDGEGTCSWRDRYDFGWLDGWSPALLAVLARASKVIPRGSATVLITGETGTGKDLLARAIHFNGPRASKPFVEVNCNALPATLLEAELFGYERGAFTDARAAKAGLFEAANGGTLFLDEIGDLSLELQGKLLRVLEDKRVRRLGSLRDLAVDVRIIAATHLNMTELVRAGRFRADLYYRLNVVPIHVPPLRERGDDILFLTHRILERLSEEYAISRPVLSPAVRRALLRYTWPGNVRELRNALERALVLGDGTLRVEDLFGEDAPPVRSSPFIPFPAPMEEIERAAAHAMVAQCGGNKSQAAEMLGISRKRLYVLLHQESGRPERSEETHPEPSGSGS